MSHLVQMIVCNYKYTILTAESARSCLEAQVGLCPDRRMQVRCNISRQYLHQMSHTIMDANVMDATYARPGASALPGLCLHICFGVHPCACILCTRATHSHCALEIRSIPISVQQAGHTHLGPSFYSPLCSQSLLGPARD